MMDAVGSWPKRFASRVGACLGWLDEKPLAVVLVAAGATIGATLALGSSAGWPHVLHVVYRAHSWAWLAVCALGEAVAYGGYVLTLRDIARVDDGPELDLARLDQGRRGWFRGLRGDAGVRRVRGRLLGLPPGGCRQA